MAGTPWEREEYSPSDADWAEYTAWCESQESAEDPFEIAFWADQPGARISRLETELAELQEWVRDLAETIVRRN
ncbi:MAG: hypothetical protein WKF75_05945 [Singulisphaera sp.]